MHRLKHLKILLTVLALAGVIALAGCGSGASTGSDATSTSASTASTTGSAATGTDSTAATDPAITAYGDQVGKIASDFGTALQSIPQASGATTPAALKSTIDQAQAQTRDAIDALNGLTVPETARPGHDQLVSAFEKFSTALTGASGAADSASSADLKQIQSDLKRAAGQFQTDVQTAAQALASAGVQIGAA